MPSLFVLDEVQCLQSPKKEYRMNEDLRNGNSITVRRKNLCMVLVN